MKTGTKVFLIILLLLISVVVVIGVDVYLSYRHFEQRAGDFDLGSFSDTVASDNQSVDITGVLTTPKLGYIPKSVRLDITVKEGGAVYGNPLTLTIKLGEAQDLNFEFNLETDEISAIELGFTVTFTVEVTATPIYLGIPLNFLAQDFDPMVINVEL
jgi:hypothetical protein